MQKGKLVGYARVSTMNQDTTMQLDALKTAGVLTIYSENESSTGARPQLHAAIAHLQPGDVLVVWKLDRIARSLLDLLSVMQKLKKMQAGLRSLTEPIDTSTPLGEFVIQVLGAVAQLERSMIRQRIVAGQVAAYKRGKRWGGRYTIPLEDLQQIQAMYDSGWYTWPVLSDMWGIPLTTLKANLQNRLIKPDPNRLPPLLGKYLEGPPS